MESFNDAIAAGRLVLVDFFATWCQPCKMQHPILEQLKATVGDRLRILTVDVDRHQDIAAQYGVRSVPTLMLFRGGEELYRESGLMSKADLMALLDPFM